MAIRHVGALLVGNGDPDRFLIQSTADGNILAVFAYIISIRNSTLYSLLPSFTSPLD